MQQNLIQKINDASNTILKNSVYGSGNYIVVSQNYLEEYKLFEKIYNRRKKIKILLGS